MIAPEFWFWNNKFRVGGVFLGIAFHVLTFTWLMNSSAPEAAGYRFLFSWYFVSFILGLPWSLIAFFIPGGDVFVFAAAVCFNGYLVGWPIDALVNHQRRRRNSRIIESYLRATPRSLAS